MNDLRFALRMLAKSPTFTLAAVLTLALGIGANTAIFTVVNGLLLRPLPYPNPARLVTLKSNQSVPDLDDIVSQNHSFEACGGIGAQAADFTGGGEPSQVETGLVTGDFFRVLDARAQLGRTLGPEDDRFEAERVVVLSHAFWQREFGGDLGIIGRAINLSGQSYTVIGVTAPDFRAPRGDFKAYVSIRLFYPEAAKARGAHLLRTYARLRQGVSLAAAQSELRVIDGRLAEVSPDENRGRQTILIPLQERLVGDTRPALLILFGAVGLVLLIACANFANLLLARSATRSQELTIRAALGASRGRLVRQVLAESVVLALLGGAAGLILGSWGVDALLALKPEHLPRAENIRLDAPVLAFTFALALVTGIVFGIVPAWQSTRVELNGVLTAGSHRLASGRSLLRSGLVVTELALALVLLTGAGLLGKAFWRLTNVSPGFDPERLMAMRVELPAARYGEIPPQTQFRERVLENMNRLPGVHAAMISELPLGGSALSHNFIIAGRPPLVVGEEPELYTRSVAGDYFKVLGIPLQRGRLLTRDDRADTPPVGVINESMARRYFHGADPIGARIRWARLEEVVWITIVGVVGDVHHFGLAQPEEPAIYTPYAQSVQAWKRWSEIVVRTQEPPESVALIAELKQAVWKVDPLIPVAKIRSMTEVMSESLSERRFNALLIGVFASVALILAAVGLYGVIAYLVMQRTHEIGVRIALGAQRGDVLKLVLAYGFALASTGIAIGVGGAWAASRLLTGFLYGVTTTDPTTYAGVTGLLLGIALLASYVPAHRATRINPIIALRYE